MILTIVNQGLTFLICIMLIKSEYQELTIVKENKVNSNFGHHVLQKGKIISKSINQSRPVDQVQNVDLQLEQNNSKEPKYVINGDILIPIKEVKVSRSKRFKRKIIPEVDLFGNSLRWPHGIVPYEFVSHIDPQARQNVLIAMQHWHEKTCIRFVPYDQAQHSHMRAKVVIKDTGSICATFVGYQPSLDDLVASHSVYLPVHCPLGSMIHELGHVIGFFHEMARADRDQEIYIKYHLLSDDELQQYEVLPNIMNAYYGQPYDLGSIMHYYPSNIMEARDSRRAFLMGQRQALSYLDAKLANLGYRCSERCDRQLICENEGYINQYCKCACPDGFYGDRCHLLQGYLTTWRRYTEYTQYSNVEDTEKLQTTVITSTSTLRTTTSENGEKTIARWLEWSDWSECSEACGSGVRIRTRVCSNTLIRNSSESCSTIQGNSFEVESCRSPECKASDIIMSCTFDVANEFCPLKTSGDWQILSEGIQVDRTRLINDHTLGDGKYLAIVGIKNRSDNSRVFQLGPFASSNEKFHCLQFWFTTNGHSMGHVFATYNKTNYFQNNYLFTLKSKDSGKGWKRIQRTFPSTNDYKIIFKYEFMSASENNYIAIDDINIIRGACVLKKVNIQRRRKRQQPLMDCSRIIDLTITNTVASITSSNYPNFYPNNVQCYYYIRVPQPFRILLQFTDFNLPTNDMNVCGDSVEIRYYHLGQQGPRYCGTGVDANSLQFVSTKNYILVVFRSVENTFGRGFRAHAKLVV